MNNQLFLPVRMQSMGATLKTVGVAIVMGAIALGPLRPSRGQAAPTPPDNPPAETPASPTLPSAEPGPESPPAAPPLPPPVSQPATDEPQVLIAEVVVEGATPELEQLVYQVISTRPGSTTTRTQLQQDTNAIFATGFFADVNAVPSDTPLGVRITFIVRPYPVLRVVQVAGNQVLTQEKVQEIFAPQIGRSLNLRELQAGIEKINSFYRDNGYILGQVVGTPQIDPDGVVTLQVAEGVVEQVTYRFLNKEGEPTKQRTRDFVISREMDTRPGVVLNQKTVQADLRRLFELGLFEDVQVALEPGQDLRKVNLILNIKERNTGSVSAGAGYSSAAGLFGTVAFQQNNLFGRNWKFSAEAQGGTEGEFLFDVSFTDPWIKGDPYRTSYTVSAFNRLTVPYTFSNGPIDVRLANGDFPRINRLGTAVFFTRPFTQDRDQVRTAWTGSLGLQYQRVTSLDGGFTRFNTDALGNCLTFPDNGVCRGFNDLFTVQAAILRDLRNDPLRPTSGQVIRLGVDQSLPIGAGSILMNRVRGSYSFYIPVKFLRIEGPQTFAFNIQAGNIFGDLPPYESFTLGGC
ncbi:BamA/TamA family outer membrane protein [Thermosynechococcus sp.]|uniref:BamA/TamA family outer membrane protein n=1 Tax=Thermosynechococcus sp. TaxID=2814275 RepID=UPI002631F5C0|nr:BamA/TamA family outer membrane protein [Thermosynechococcus sp.]